MWKKVEMGAPLSYPCYLCLSGPGLLVLLLLPWGPAAQSTKGESAYPTPLAGQVESACQSPGPLINKGKMEAYFASELHTLFSGNREVVSSSLNAQNVLNASCFDGSQLPSSLPPFLCSCTPAASCFLSFLEPSDHGLRPYICPHSLCSVVPSKLLMCQQHCLPLQSGIQCFIWGGLHQPLGQL